MVYPGDITDSFDNESTKRIKKVIIFAMLFVSELKYCQIFIKDLLKKFQ